MILWWCDWVQHQQITFASVESSHILFDRWRYFPMKQGEKNSIFIETQMEILLKSKNKYCAFICGFCFIQNARVSLYNSVSFRKIHAHSGKYVLILVLVAYSSNRFEVHLKERLPIVGSETTLQFFGLTYNLVLICL